MMDVVWQGKAKFTAQLGTNMPRAILIPKIALFAIATATGLLSGCSTSAPQPPVAEQKADLFDMDSDGVINARDECDSTPRGAIIDNVGCSEFVETEARDDLHVLFANNSVKIPPSFEREVQELARFMTTFPHTLVQLKGYASPSGSAELNLALSTMRAQAIKSALVKKGIASTRITIMGFGESEPVAAPSAQQTEILSRRVTASVMNTEMHVIKKWTIYTSSPAKS
ncbi:OmpA family protein [Enterovibrio calviensis]|uniref:OmpA family protein n=1 Tax=Enterovibrio calviensis TaxID=91359 RepID=UPI000683E0CE|nr:OmpA family protein [Enterovibrio calviensis]